MPEPAGQSKHFWVNHLVSQFLFSRTASRNGSLVPRNWPKYLSVALCQFLGDLFVEDVFHGQGTNHYTTAGEGKETIAARRAPMKEQGDCGLDRGRRAIKRFLVAQKGSGLCKSA